MNTKFTGKNSHMTLDDRIEIQECLSHGMSFKAIGQRIGKDQTTVSKEIKKHITISLATVKRMDKCGNAVIAVCPKLLKPPFVCNPCPKARSACAFDRHIYRAKTAQSEYELLLSEAREGIPLNKQEFYEMDRVVSEGIRNGQHLYHILNTTQLNVGMSTVYRHLKNGLLSVAPIDFPRVVKFKPRGCQKVSYVPKGLKIGRSYMDFLAFKEDNALVSWVEMDTVIGRIGGKTVLTFDFVPCNFMIGLLLDENSSLEVTRKVTGLKTRLAYLNRQFKEFFFAILTDNGGEFANVFAIENNSLEQKETHLFFCDPLQSCQKPHVEKNHTLFRDIAPKGTSFDNFTQEHLNIIFSHINFVKRQSLSGKSPYDIFSFWFDQDAPALFDIALIAPQTVIQSPKLIKTLGIKLEKS